MATTVLPVSYGPSLGDINLGTGDSVDVTVSDATQNASSTVQTLTHTYNAGAGADGLGVQVLYKGETETAGTNATIAAVRAVFTDATAATEDGAFRIGVVTGASVPAAGSEQFQVTGADGIVVIAENSATAAVTDVAVLRSRSSGTPAAGIGCGVVFATEDGGGADQDIAKIRATLTTVTAGSEVGSFRVAVQNTTMPAAGSEDFWVSGGGHCVVKTTLSVGTGALASGLDLQVGNASSANQFTGYMAAATGYNQFLYYHGSTGYWDFGMLPSDNTFYIRDTSTSAQKRISVTVGGKLVLNEEGGRSTVIGGAALATNATDGFLYIPTCAGTPTGVPTAQTGTVAMIFDTTNNKLYIYDGSWLGGTTPGAFV